MKIIKLLLKLFVVIALVLIIAAVAIVYLVDPSHFKPKIENQLTSALNRDTKIDGSIRVKIFPRIGLAVNNIKVANDSHFGKKEFANIQSLRVNVELKPLLQQQLKINSIEFYKAKFNLTVDKKGKTNWQTLATSDQATESEQPQTGYFKLENTQIKKIMVSDSSVVLNNQNTGHHVTFSNINVSINDVRTKQAFPINVSYHTKGQEKHGDKVTNFKGYHQFNGTVAFDVERWQKNNRVLSALTIKGKGKISDLTIDKFKLSQIASTINIQQQKINLNPINANLYNGSASGTLSMNFQPGTPSYQLNADFKGVNAAQFFQDTIGVSRMSGSAYATLALTTSGQDGPSLTKNLDGNVSFDLRDGEVKGFDIPFLMKWATAVFEKDKVKGHVSGNSRFSTLKGSAVINNGVLNNNDLLFLSEAYKVTGGGQVNLNTEMVNYKVLIDPLKTETPIVKNIQEILAGGIPVIIKGKWDSLNYQPDMAALIAARAQAIIKAPMEIPTAPIKILQGILPGGKK